MVEDSMSDSEDSGDWQCSDGVLLCSRPSRYKICARASHGICRGLGRVSFHSYERALSRLRARPVVFAHNGQCDARIYFS